MTGYQRQSQVGSKSTTADVALNWMNHYLGPGEQQSQQQQKNTNVQNCDESGHEQHQQQTQIPRNWQEYKGPYKNWQEYKAMTSPPTSENTGNNKNCLNGIIFQPDDSQRDIAFPLKNIKVEEDEDIYCIHDTFRYGIIIRGRGNDQLYSYRTSAFSTRTQIKPALV